jgi:predicted RNase H-like HicB family nuclease
MRVVLLVIAVLVLAGFGSAARGSGHRTPGVTAVEAPLPASAKGRHNVALTDVACAAPGDCAATGYLLTSTVSRALLFVEKDGRWSVSEPPLPGTLRRGKKSETVSSISCPAAGHCVAVGFAASGPQLEPLIFTQRTRGWQETVPPLPAGAKGGTLDLVSCPSIGNCTAAGTSIDSSGNDQGLLLDESNRGWGPPTTAGLPPNGSVTTPGQTAAIEGLSCWAPGNCAAVGLYGDTYGSPQGWLLVETDGVWAQGVEARLPANASTREGSYLYPVINLEPVSCAPNGDCTAVGGYGDRRSHPFGMILSEHAGHWGPAKQTALPANAGPNPQQGNAPDSPMGSIACPAAGTCSAVGWYLDHHRNSHGLLLRERAGRWSRSGLVFPPGASSAPGISLDSVACRSAGNCLAVGTYNPAKALRPLLVTERNGRWSNGTEAPLPRGAGKDFNGILSSVSCPSAGTCVAVGFTETAGFLNKRGLIVTIRRG